MSLWNTDSEIYTTMYLPIIYPSGSLQINLSLNQTQFVKTIKQLQEVSWIDTNTRSVELEIVVYSAYTEVIAYILFQTAFAAQGATVPSVFWYFISGADVDTPGGPLILRLIQVIFIISYIAVKIRDFVIANDKRTFLADRWNIVDIVWVTALLATVMSSFTQQIQVNAYDLTNKDVRTIWSFLFWREFAQGLILAFSYYRLVYYTRVLRSTGILMSTLGMIARDILLFMVVSFSIMLGFAFILLSLYGGTEFLDFRNFGSAVLILMKAIPGNYNFHTQDDETGGKSGRIAFASTIEGIYLLLTILFVNLLIAMLSWTYNRIADEAVQRWSFQFAHVIQALRGTTWPPPFNILGYIYHYDYSKKDKNKSKTTNSNAIDATEPLNRLLVRMYENVMRKKEEEESST
eukprot:TRINITY_DN1241_c0_g1_i1.p1 TRINITY_DN1241_c0_g1~~TRINITY_DN1241_c0_g1_i1.p1  ORF type:complete len:466 (+),score=39.22 TRINITY_DN1241_c0_g1_i1:185-1399(+)